MISCRTSGAEMRTAASGAGLPAPEQAPTLTMPTYDPVRPHEDQMLAPAGTQPMRQDPQQLVPGVKTGTPSGPSRTGQHRKLLTQQEVLEHEVVAWTHPGHDGRE